MKKYFCLQLKLVAKQFPSVLAVTLVLLMGVGILFSGLMVMLGNSDVKKQYTIGITGDTDNPYMKWGLATMQSVQADQVSVFVVEMTTEAAQSALEKSEISAYVIIPEGFMEDALAGDITPVTYVTSAGLEGVASLLKKEITRIVTEIVVQSQKGAFGLEAALEAHQLTQEISDHMTNLSLEYTDLIFHRSALYSVKELGISDGLSTRDYYLCAMLIILLTLTGIPFAAIYIRKDNAMSQLLLSRGISAGKQLLCEFGAYLLSMLALSAVVLVIGARMVVGILTPEPGELPGLGVVALRVFPVIVMLTAMNMLIFTCCSNLISGLLMHFFAAIGLCYISGCIYPVYAFPEAVWPVASRLPTGLARSLVATGFSGDSPWKHLGGLLAYAVVFCSIALCVRIRKTTGSRR